MEILEFPDYFFVPSLRWFALVIRVCARVPLSLLISHLTFELRHLAFLIGHLSFDISPSASNLYPLTFFPFPTAAPNNLALQGTRPTDGSENPQKDQEAPTITKATS